MNARIASVFAAPGLPGRDVSLFRLYLLRALYLLLALGQGSIQLQNLTQGASLGFWEGTTDSMLGALALLSLFGVRYPLRMLPLLIFELTWKAIWTLAIALPLWSAHRLTGNAADNVGIIAGGVVLCVLVIPWSFVWKNYAIGPGDRWK